MKRTVTITLEIDPLDYHLAKDTAEDTINVVIDCLKGDADFATYLHISCEDKKFRLCPQ